MNHFRFLSFMLCAAFCAALAAPAAAQTGAGWLRTRFLDNALNPKISAVPDFHWNTGPRSGDGGASLKEVEIAIQSDIDPYGHADIFIAFPTGHGHGPELEEAFFTLTALPWRLQARGGKFLPNFGRVNLIHEHELDQTDFPLIVTRFLGDEGMNVTGAEASWVAGFGPVFFEASYGVAPDLGAEEEEKTVDVCLDPPTCAVTQKVKVSEDEAARNRVRDYAQFGKTRFYGELTDTSDLELGFSGALHRPQLAEARRLGAADLTFRWKPKGEGLYKSFIWRSEFMYSHRELTPEEDLQTGTISASAADTHRRGFYSYMTYQPARRWRFGARFDYAEDAADRTNLSPQREFSPYVTYYLSEFQRFRGQYEYRRLAGGADEHRGTFQWTVTLGPHGAHPY